MASEPMVYPAGAPGSARPLSDDDSPVSGFSDDARAGRDHAVSIFDHPDFDDHEQVVFCHDPATGLKAIIAIHSTVLGPALGGCRMWPYAAEDEAVTDVLRLSQAMTLKHALAGSDHGGGKTVIIGDPATDKSPALFHALGRFVDSLGGRFIAAEDVGITVEDIGHVREVTPHAAGLADTGGGSGDPSPVTAWGVFCGIRAAVAHKLGRDDLAGVRVAVQGLGHVGYHLCRHLHQAGAGLQVADINQGAVAKAVSEFSAEAVDPATIHTLDVDVYAPCALGGALNPGTIPQIRATVVAGAANNQLLLDSDGRLLAERGILYAPDYVINAGGVINILFEGGSYDHQAALDRAAKIGDTLVEIFRRADEEGQPTNAIADRMAMERIEAARSTREPA